jgi:hypothetical protein
MTAFGELVKNTTYIVETPLCGFCKKGGTIEVPMEGFLIYQLGGYVQEAFPELDKSLREQIISGTHPKCWDKAYGEGGHA